MDEDTLYNWWNRIRQGYKAVPADLKNAESRELKATAVKTITRLSEQDDEMKKNINQIKSLLLE